jgi:diadenosine tetraphosphate (Ap4A) HIT family hydrolase
LVADRKRELDIIRDFNENVVAGGVIWSMEPEKFVEGVHRYSNQLFDILKEKPSWNDPNLQGMYNSGLLLLLWVSTIHTAKLFDVTREQSDEERRECLSVLQGLSDQVANVWDEGLNIGKTFEHSAKGKIHDEWYDSSRAEECIFCNLSDDELMRWLPPAEPDKSPLECSRGIVKSDCCIATLAPEQYSKGHSLVIFRRHHVEDLSDRTLTASERAMILDMVSAVSDGLKRAFGAERVYVASLCDGVRHLHFHLIPRYETNVRGFSYMGERETQHNLGNPVGPSHPERRAGWIQDTAKRLRQYID